MSHLDFRSWFLVLSHYRDSGQLQSLLLSSDTDPSYPTINNWGVWIWSSGSGPFLLYKQNKRNEYEGTISQPMFDGVRRSLPSTLCNSERAVGFGNPF